MKKWHISDRGEAVRCYAEVKTCPRAGTGHFGTESEAAQVAEELLFQEYGFGELAIDTSVLAESLYPGLKFVESNNYENILEMPLGNSTLHIELDGQSSEEIKQSIANRLSNYDPAIEFAESSYSSGGEGAYDELSNYILLSEKIRKIAANEGLESIGTFQSEAVSLSPSLEGIPSPETPVSDEAIEDFLKSSNMDYGNAEWDAYSDKYYLGVEAPNNSYVNIVVPKTSKMRDVYSGLAKNLKGWKARNVFDYSWDGAYESARGNNPIAFKERLDADERFFSEASRILLKRAK